jgi:quercetin dioxygenase-like cupin family protein
MTDVKFHGRDEAGMKNSRMGLAYLLPRGGAEYDALPTEGTYFVLEGEVSAGTEEEKIVLKKGESIHLDAHEGRFISNETNEPASLLVIVNY